MGAKNGAHIYKKLMPSGKSWVFVVTTRPDGAALGFWDWYEQIRLLRECEEEKYAGRSLDPLALPRRFFERCWAEPLPTYEELAIEFSIPDRGQSVPLDWEPPPTRVEPCRACGAFLWKACSWLRNREGAPPDTCVALVPEARR